MKHSIVTAGLLSLLLLSSGAGALERVLDRDCESEISSVNTSLAVADRE